MVHLLTHCGLMMPHGILDLDQHCLRHGLLPDDITWTNIDCQLLHSYLLNRRQRAKIGCLRSDWVERNKGVPQDSVLGPLIFNIFINDIIFYVRGDCSIFNYADGDTMGIAHKDLTELKGQLVKCTKKKAIKWFESNHMKSNASKFQAMIMKPSDCVKLLGAMLMINCDFRTTFLSFVHEFRDKLMLSTEYQNSSARISRLNYTTLLYYQTFYTVP